ncbi:MAG: T9SS type A sorting domain-containing protein [Planctomycetia bacterium]|nr:T9SS type A sorting domain-containing protein [Planctomycetia bacterium]
MQHATSLQIFDITGRLMETLVNGELVSGEHEITWNADNLPSGVYFVRLQSGEFVMNQKVLLIK